MSNFVDALGSSLAWLIIGAIVVGLIIRDNKKNNANAAALAANNATSSHGGHGTVAQTKAAPAPAPKPKDPYRNLNILLYVGSFLLVIGVISFLANTHDDMVAPATLILTAIFYSLGLFLFKKVDYLRNVGGAFAFSALAIIPFWFICFISLDVDPQAAYITSTVCSLIAYFVTGCIFNNRALGYLFYLTLPVLAYALTPFSADKGTAWWLSLVPPIFAMVPSILLALKPNWLPVFIRKATTVLGRFFFMLFWVPPTIFWFLIPNVAQELPLIRTVLCLLLCAWLGIRYYADKSAGHFVALRFGIQSAIFALVADALNYSIIQSSLQSNESNTLTVVGIWTFTFLGQALISLFIPKANEKAVRAEHAGEVFSLFGLFLTPLFTSSLSDQLGGAVLIMVAIAIGVLSIAYTIIHKKAGWYAATLLALMFIAYVLSEMIMPEIWTEWHTVASFFVIAAAALALYKFFGKGENENTAYAITLTALILSAIFMSGFALEGRYAEVGLFASAVSFAIFGLLAKKSALLETAVYVGAVGIASLVDTCFNLAIPHQSYDQTMALNLVKCLIIGLTPLATSIWFDGDKTKARFVISYIILSISLYFIGINGGKGWMLPELINQVAFLTFGALKDREWLIWTNIVLMPITALTLTGGINFIWFGSIGLLLILVVVWRLTRMHNKVAAAAKPEKPEKPTEE